MSVIVPLGKHERTLSFCAKVENKKTRKTLVIPGKEQQMKAKMVLVLACAILAQGSLVLAKPVSVGGTTTNEVGLSSPHHKGVSLMGPTLMGPTTGIPPGNWSATGVKAEMVMFISPNTVCDRNFWIFSAEEFLQNGTGLVPVMNQPRDLIAVASLEWYDFVDTMQSDIYSFRDRPAKTVASGCAQRDVRVVALLRYRSSPEPIRLTGISGGALSDEDTSSPKFDGHIVDFSFKELPGYSDYVYGVSDGPDRLPGTADDVVLANGESKTKQVDHLYYVGFWVSNEVEGQKDLDYQRDYFRNKRCTAISFWYRIKGVSGNTLYEGGIDLPVGQSKAPAFPMRFSVGRPNAGKIPLTIKPWGSQVWFVDSAPAVNGPWTSHGDLLPKPAGTYQIPATGPTQFFRLRQ